MDFLLQIITNRILVVGVASWFLAQVFKTISNFILTKKFSIERLFGDGGMPSAHSATVTAVAATAGMECGFDSPVFAVAAILAIIVMHDAMGVRLEAGKQAQVINEMIQTFVKLGDTKISAETKLKEFVGHTPIQVFAGFLLGLLIAILFCTGA